MSVYVFLGPTLTIDEAGRVLDARYLPPAAQGDVYRIAKQRPMMIGIIDGLFQHVPSIWHKEILWAMSEGVHVFGSASMGALRAAELHEFGMRGVGEIFEAYRDGVLTDDDEVAVLHGPAELQYKPLSDAMVNIRATLRAAEKNGIIAAVTRTLLEKAAKAAFYQDRSFARLLREGDDSGADALELRRLREALPAVSVDQKKNDALGMLAQMRESVLCQAPAPKVRYALEHTRTWIPAEEDTELWTQSAP